jgi:hypothetical protein
MRWIRAIRLVHWMRGMLGHRVASLFRFRTFPNRSV